MVTARDLIQIGETVTIGGVEYQLSELNAADYVLCETEILKGRPGLADMREAGAAMMAALPAGDPGRSEIARDTFKQLKSWRQVTAEEMNEWRVTPGGFVFAFWLMIRKKHPEINHDAALKLIDVLGNESLQEIARSLSGLPEGNSPSPAKEKTTEETTPSPGLTTSTT